MATTTPHPHPHPELQSRRIGWIGLGSMGLAMATNLHKYLNGNLAQSPTQCHRPLLFFNRTPSRGDGLEALGAERCATIEELMGKADVVFISASDDAAVEAIVGDIVKSSAGALKVVQADTTDHQSPPPSSLKGKIIIDTTTIHPRTTASISALLTSHGALFASCPVFGASPVAERGELLVAFAGPESAYAVVEPLVRGSFARTKEVLMVGREPEKALLLKTCGNFIVAGLMEVIAESHVLAEKTSLPAPMLEKLLEHNFGPLAHSTSIRMTSGIYVPPRDTAPWSDIDLAIKDVGHGVDVARTAGVRLEVGEMALEHLVRAREEEGKGRRLDSSALYGVVRKDSGLDFKTEFVKERDGEA
ncbi:hypothetical protein F5Y17DRAFT_451984 [Xylariaceae sp. FL0594]|nr:hypothetical protein F5Y17DRAFT_451984 [Xylariaceae sp. FL0594]